MMVQNSDTVAYGGRLYRVMAALDCKEYKSVTPPTHTEGIKEYDGIKWIMIQDDVEYEAGCRNIVSETFFCLKNALLLSQSILTKTAILVVITRMLIRLCKKTLYLKIFSYEMKLANFYLQLHL